MVVTAECAGSDRPSAAIGTRQAACLIKEAEYMLGFIGCVGLAALVV
jgi:hypothetical protein